MKVLADTSVWIRFLSNRAPYALEMDELLSRDAVSGHDFIYGELLMGDKGRREPLLTNYRLMDQAPLLPHSDVVAFVRGRKLNGRGIGWVEVHLLASALVGQLKIWTADAALATVAAELGIRYS